MEFHRGTFRATGSARDRCSAGAVRAAERNTVKTHTRNLYGKLGAHGRTEAVGRALGLLAPPARP